MSDYNLGRSTGQCIARGRAFIEVEVLVNVFSFSNQPTTGCNSDNFTLDFILMYKHLPGSIELKLADVGV